MDDVFCLAVVIAVFHSCIPNDVPLFFALYTFVGSFTLRILDAMAVYRMDVLFRMACVLTNAVNTVSLANSIRGDKAIKMSTYINGACIGDCDVCRISPVVVGSTNAVVYAHFPQVSLVGMQTMSDFQSIVNSTNNELTVCLEGIADVISPYIPLRGDVTLISNFFDETLLKVSEFATESNGNVWLLSRGVSQKR